MYEYTLYIFNIYMYPPHSRAYMSFSVVGVCVSLSVLHSGGNEAEL